MIFFLFARRRCQSLLSHYFELTAELGVPLTDDKVEGLSSILTFLDTEMDTILDLSKLPTGKLVQLQSMILSFLQKKSSLMQILSITGSLELCLQDFCA